MDRFINVVIPPLSKPYTYELPEALWSEVHVGSKVSVPLGNRWAAGYVVSKKGCFEAPSALPGFAPVLKSFEVKPIQKIVGTYPHFHPEQLEFFEWVAHYYGDNLSNVIDVAIPPYVPPKFARSVTLFRRPGVAPKSRVQREIIDLLEQSSTAVPWIVLTQRFRNAPATLKKLEADGIIQINTEELFDHHLLASNAPAWAKTSVELSSAQAQALTQISDSIDKAEFRTFLLYGVTGSGKTEVYIEAIQRALQHNLQALVIVPEIALTPQLLDRFRARLGPELAILHSGLPKRARWDSWRALLEGRNRVAIGARSGIFAPLARLGVIIVDEEHDTSFKQSDGLRYNARDLALVRGQFAHCPVILGSATPSLESLQKAIDGKYTQLALSGTSGFSSKFSVDVVDMNKVKPWEMLSKHISPTLYEALCQALARKEQAFILYNRRGFATYLQCERCGDVLSCPNCTVTLTYHQFNNSLVCHYCNFSTVQKELCSKCPDTQKNQSDQPGKLTQRGGGTEKVYEELLALFPDAAIDRLDRDAAQDIEMYRKIIEKARSGATHILVGTQMIAKGHDLPNVTLVGVVDCDVGLHLPDFRASERVFQLLTQASGRSGRGEKFGRVILQTRTPEHPSLINTIRRDYRAFADQELRSRKSAQYPPFSRMLRIVVSSQDKSLANKMARKLKELTVQYRDAQALKFLVLGPSPTPIEKIKAQWRFHILLKGRKASTLVALVDFLRSKLKRSTALKVIFDMDPQEMM